MGLELVSGAKKEWMIGHILGVVNSKLKAGRAPLDQVEGRLGLESTCRGTAVAGNNVTTVQECDSHVLAVARVANYHLVVGLKAYLY